MIEKSVEVNIVDDGARPIAKLVQIANQYKSRVNIIQNSKTVNAKSIMGMMTIGLSTGQSIGLEIDGEDEGDAMDSIETFLLGR